MGYHELRFLIDSVTFSMDQSYGSRRCNWYKAAEADTPKAALDPSPAPTGKLMLVAERDNPVSLVNKDGTSLLNR